MAKKAAKRPNVGVAIVGPADAESRRYRAEEAMRTLTRAAEHRKDRALMRDVKALAKKHMAAVAKAGR